MAGNTLNKLDPNEKKTSCIEILMHCGRGLKDSGSKAGRGHGMTHRPGPWRYIKSRPLRFSQPQVVSGLRTPPLRGPLKRGYSKGAHLWGCVLQEL